MKKPRVKICCIASIEEAKLAISYGASDLGLVGPMPSGPGVISNDEIKSISKKIPSSISTFLLTSESTANNIIKHHQKVETTTIQLVDTIEIKEYATIRQSLPKVKLVKVIHVQDENSINEAIQFSEHVDALLLDSGKPKASTKILGGTGKTHNWEISRRIKQSIAIPLYLAGGLNSKNVNIAIKMVEPDGIDLCSGVRTDDKLDERKLKAFFAAVNS